MATNDFIGFASAGSANIMSQADYAAAAEQTDGVQPGPASSALANKVWRQGANMAAALGQLIVDQGLDALDNGDVGTLKTNLLAAFLASIGYRVEFGNWSSGSVPANGQRTFSPVFSEAFSATPVVHIGLYTSGATVPNGYGPITCVVESASVSGFTGVLVNNSATGRSPVPIWIAVGKV